MEGNDTVIIVLQVSLVLVVAILLLLLLARGLNKSAKKAMEASKIKEQKLINGFATQGINATRSFFKKIFFDDDSKRLAIVYYDSTVNGYNYSDILDYQIKAHSETQTTSDNGLSRAVVGGVLFGGAGAVVGANTASSTSRSMITSYTITIFFKGGISDAFAISQNELMKIFIEFHNVHEDVDKLQAVLLDIIKSNSPQLEAKTETSELSSADEIVKFKKLYDDGVITFEEFEEKKQQLLKS